MNEPREGGFTLVELMLVLVVLTVVMAGLGATGGLASRAMSVNERRSHTCDKAQHFMQRITSFSRSGVLTTYRVESTAADVVAGRAGGAGLWIDPVDGEARAAVQFSAADGALAMNAGSITPPITLRFRLDDGENPAQNPAATAGVDDDGDGMVDEGEVSLNYDGLDVGMLRDIDSCTFTLDGYLLTVRLRTARDTRSSQQFVFERAFALRNN